MWLHHGVKETEGIEGEFLRHDDDWMTVLICDVSPGQIWFKKAREGESFGECKLGGFQWARVCGSVGGRVAVVDRVEDADFEKQLYWAPVGCRFVLFCFVLFCLCFVCDFLPGHILGD